MAKKKGTLKGAAGKKRGALKGSAGKKKGSSKGAAGKKRGALKGSAGKKKGSSKGAAGKKRGALKGSAGKKRGSSKGAAGKKRGALKGSAGKKKGSSKGAAGKKRGALKGSAGKKRGSSKGAAGKKRGALKGSAGKKKGALKGTKASSKKEGKYLRNNSIHYSKGRKASSQNQVEPKPQPEKDTILIGNVLVECGKTCHLKLKVSEGYTSRPVHIPVSVINGDHDGPKLFVTAAIHGDELNGVEVVRQLIHEVDLTRLHGTLVLVPVVNVLGFENSTRYLPDRRDLNRMFPGDPSGSAAERIADKIFHIAMQCDFGIDLHTAATGRSNMPHIRAEMANKTCKRMAKAFGTRVIIDHPGVKRSLRHNCTDQGVPTILLEAGSSNKFEPRMVSIALRGVLNILYDIGMLRGRRQEPTFRVIVKTTEWVRVDTGGLMDMKIGPGDLVNTGDILATVENPFGKERESVTAPFTGMVVGVATNPLVFPGGPVCHLVKIDKALQKVREALEKSNGF